MSSNTTPVDASILDKMEYEILIQAINGISKVRSHDEEVLHIASLGVFISLLTVILTAFIFWRQKKLIEQQNATIQKQADIAVEQAEITKKQTEIMDLQNKITLFDKRHFHFTVFSDLYLNSASFDILDDEILGEIESKLTKDLISNYNKLKICSTIILSQNILEFDSEEKQAKYNLVNYSNIKIKNLLNLIYPIRYIFNFDTTQANEFNKLVSILLDILRKPERDEEAMLKSNLKRLETFFETSPLYEHLEKQVYIVNNLKYFYDDMHTWKN